MKIHYFWYCRVCGISNQPAASMEDARVKLEVHDKEAHKGKFVGGFGFLKTLDTGEPVPYIPGNNE